MLSATKTDWISSKEAAELIGKTKEWMSRVGRGEGKGPPWYVIGGRFQYDREEVLAWRAAQRRGG